ncbi:hydrogenase expression/formation protein HypE [Pontibacter anaerobius]|uniref:Hydrogenase expression/formation protein HypE n=1 Tax=Pontibacter anaerobius TaxID=2993940 RepID=A0ABT3RE78_9BACT|nr:hydrogenase expression/formation protein HypE [Pontibacter anaerobius]MCX2739734.1 hydrogenase expression/formation protein HypE [Pontibacter anaerobius]
MEKTTERFTIAHGSGGELTNQLLESETFEILQNEYLQKKHDGAVFELSGKLAFTTDSYVVSPLFFPGGNIGDLAVNGTVNDLAMCGARAKYLSLSFILEEGFSIDEFHTILLSIRKAADKADVLIVTGDTKVVERGKGDKIFINTSGIGQVHPNANIDAANIEIGDKILISGPVASHGMAIMSVREGLEFESQIRSDTASVQEQVMTLLDEFGQDIHFLRDPTRGGVATVLNEIARQMHLGISVDERKIPVREQVRSACEMLGIDPLYVANEGTFLVWVKAEASEMALEKLQAVLPTGQQAAVIGSVVAEHPGQVIIRTEIGGRRVVAMPSGEQLPRIC